MSPTITARVWKRARRVALALRLADVRATRVEIGDGRRIGPGCDLALGFAPTRRATFELGAICELAARAILNPCNGLIRIDRLIFVGPHTTIYGHGGVPIGKGTLLAKHRRTLALDHFLPPLHVIGNLDLPWRWSMTSDNPVSG